MWSKNESICDMVGQIMQKKEEERRIAEVQAAKDRYWKIPICYDDDEDYNIAITPVLSTKEPVDSLIMEDEHLSTSVENLVQILMESDDDSYENIEYVDATPPNSELVSLEEVEDVILRNKLSNVYLLISKIEALNDNPTLSSFTDNSFSNHTEETRSGKDDQGGLTSVVISDNSNDPLLELPEFESFHFDLDPSFPRPPPEPPDVEINLIIETNAPEINNFDELNEDECFDQWEIVIMLR
ncbi:hypothetical protein Tco_0899794 [Tanacetum coccineum]